MRIILNYAAVILIFVSGFFIWHDHLLKLIGLGFGFVLLGLSEIARQLEKIAQLHHVEPQIQDEQPISDLTQDLPRKTTL